jgi:hypothetical protein
MFFSARYLKTNPLKLKQKLIKKVYPLPALPPANKRIFSVNPGMPDSLTLDYRNNSIRLAWKKGENTKNFIIYKFKKGDPVDLSDPKAIFAVTPENSLDFASGSRTKISRHFFVITSQSITNTESEPVYAVSK